MEERKDGRFYPNADEDWRNADYDPTGPGWAVMAIIAFIVMCGLTGLALGLYEIVRVML